MKNFQPEESPAQTKRSETPKKQHPEVDTINPEPVELGGPKGPEPTRYGDWEQAGRCTDF